MKFNNWKILGIAGALVLGYVVSSQAAEIKVDEDTFADFGLGIQAMYKYLDERGADPTAYNANWFGVTLTRVYFDGQINKYVQFYADIDATHRPIFDGSEWHTESESFDLQEGGVNLAFIPEFQIRFGELRIPFTRYQMVDEFARLMPTDALQDPQSLLYGLVDAGFYYPLDLINPGRDGITGGIEVHGDLLNGMFRYTAGIFNENNVVPGDDPYNSLAYAVRVEFTPTMMGFSPESTNTPSGKIADTYLGKKDVFTIGVGYYYERIEDDNLNANEDIRVKGYTIDAMFEKKYGTVVPNVQVGYVYLDDSHVYQSGTNNWKVGDTYMWYIQGQLLSDTVIGIGKPAISARYEYKEVDGTWDTQHDLTAYTYSVALNYYIEGKAAQISAGLDYTRYDDAAEAILDYCDYDESLTDLYLFVQTKF